MAKYNNQKALINGVAFDSKREAKRFKELSLMERSGIIQDLKRQVKFELIPAQYELVNGKRKCVERALNYFADFAYYKNGRYIVEDAKGYRTDKYIIKRKLMLYIHNIRIKET